MSERATFSPFWHRVRTLKPRLRPHVQITRQHYRGRRWHVVHDPASNQFYRLNPIAHEFVGMLDGQREVEAAWKIALGKFGDSAPTQNEVIQLLTQLYSANLLSGDVPPETEQLLRRGRERLKKRIQQQAIGIMYFKVRVFNPDRILNALEPIVRPVLNRWGLLVWAIFILSALWQIIPKWDQLTTGFENLRQNPDLWGWLIVVWVALKAIHESGHGLICKRFGGQVPEFGLMLLVLFPSPYVDASATWAFASKWQRAAVGAGGMIFELFMAAIAAWVWVGADEGSLVRQLAYNAMLTASVSTVFFNANPLMRFDGYYILADLLETPNLAQRSNQLLKHLIQKYIYRLERPSAILPSTLRGEQVILFIYGVLALAYRIFLFISITLLVMSKLFAIGLLLAIWTAAAWFVIPVGAFIHWLASNASLSEHRARAVAASAAMIAIGVLLIGIIPMPDHRRAYGVLDSENRSGVFIGADGFVREVHKRPGESIAKDEPILTMESPELRQERRRLLAMIAETSAEEGKARKESQPAAARIAADRISLLHDNLAELDSRLDRLVVSSPIDGVIVRADPARLLGAYIKRGEMVCEVVDIRSIRVAAVVGQNDADWLFDHATPPTGPQTAITEGGPFTVRIRLLSRADEDSINGVAIRVLDAGRNELPSAALGFGGGGKVEVESQDRTGMLAKRPTFTVYVTPELPAGTAGDWVGSPGERVKLRFTLRSKPLLVQWLDRLNKTIQGRVNV